MSMEEGEDREPKTVVAHSLDPVQRFQTTMGAINYQFIYDHFFIGANAFMDLMIDFNVWLDSLKYMKLPADDRTGAKIPDSLDEKTVYELGKIWYGNCKLYQKRNENLEVIKQAIVFDVERRLRDNEEIIELPALMHMNPKSRTKDDTNPKVLIQEAIPVSIAFDGYDVDQIAQEFKFSWQFADGVVPMFKSDEDVMTSDALVIEIPREQYHKIIRKLVMAFKPRKSKIFAQMTDILVIYRRIMNLKAVEQIKTAEQYK